MKKYDVIVIGGGTSGVAAAYMAAKLGLKALVAEKAIHLGGTMTSGLVTPVMKTEMLDINNTFFNDLIETAKEYNAQLTYSDGNPGWFNPELLKIVLDKMLVSVNCDVLYSTEFESAAKKNSYYEVNLKSETLSIQYETKYLVDASGFGFVAKNLSCNFLDSESFSQATTLRFIMSNVKLDIFEEWITKLDSNRNITTSTCIDGSIHLSTAYTWDTNKEWALRPVFKEAIANGDLLEEDSSYFQIFTIPRMPTAVAFNCPRILIDSEQAIDKECLTTKLLIKGREQIYRLSRFCNKYLPGFENAYISNIADMLGIRESGRVEGQYIYDINDMVKGKTFDNIALSTNYPIDIHSKSKNSSTLEFGHGNYFLPIESLISKKYDDLYIVGRHLSATFKAQGALRTQSSCFSMGEAVARHIKSRLV